MKAQEFVEARSALNDFCEQLLNVKGADYTVGKDRLYNFKEVGALLGVKPTTVWAVYFLKHIFAILKWVRDGSVDSEPIEGRIADARNYLDLVYGLYVEANRPQDKKTADPEKRPSHRPLLEPTPKGWHNCGMSDKGDS